MQTADLEGIYLSSQQSRLWSLQQESPLHNSLCSILLCGKLDIKAFQDGLHHIVNRHEILRTVFYQIPGLEVPVQVVREQVEVNCPVIDLSGLGERQHQQCVQQMWAEQQQEP